MRKFLLPCGVFLVSLGLLGCNFIYSFLPMETPEILATPASPQVPKLTGDWQIRLGQSGGFVGVLNKLEITSHGAVTVTNERQNKQNTFQLSPEQLAQLKELVASTRYHPPTVPLGCDDCFVYHLQIDNGRERFEVEIDDANLPNSGLETLIGFLRTLLDRNLP